MKLKSLKKKTAFKIIN